MIDPGLTGVLVIYLKRDFKERLRQKLSTHDICIRELHGVMIPYIHNNGPCRMVDIADYCQVRPQSMTTAISELEAMGYLTRQASETDKRAKLIVLTDAGSKLIEKLDATTREVWRDYEAMVGKEKLDQMLSTMDELLAVASEKQ